jgi:hypothetical protein
VCQHWFLLSFFWISLLGLYIAIFSLGCHTVSPVCAGLTSFSRYQSYWIRAPIL